MEELCEWASTELVEKKVKVNIIIRALGSKEMKATYGTALDRLGHKLAEVLNADYKPDILKKSRFTYPLKRLEFNERKNEIKNTYYLDYNFCDKDSVLIIDDIYSSGATIQEIIRSLRVANQTLSIYFFTLAKTSFYDASNKDISLPSNIEDRNIEKLEEPIVAYNRGLSYGRNRPPLKQFMNQRQNNYAKC